MLGFVGGSPNRPGRGHCAEEWKRFPLPAKFPPYSQSALPDRCNSLSPPAPFEKQGYCFPPTAANQSSFTLFYFMHIGIVTRAEFWKC